MNIKFKNAKVLTLSKKDEMGNYIIDENQDVIIKDDLIDFVGSNEEYKAYEKENKNLSFHREIDVKNNLLMPSFKNMHTHSAMTFARSLADDYPLDIWLNKYIFPLEDKLTPDDIYYFSILAIMEYLTSGISANADMYKFYDAMADASCDMNFRTTIIESLTKFDKEKEKAEENFNRYNNYPKDKNHLISYQLGLHAEYTNDESTFKYISALVHKYKAKFFTHNSETKKEVENCKNKYHMTPTELFDSFGLYDFGGGAYHAVYLSDNDIKIFKKKNIYVITNPCSNLKLSSGIAPLKKYLDSGINLAIGTDGASSNNALDFFREMYLASTLSKYLTNDPGAISASEILNMACKGYRMFSNENLGEIKKGNIADIIMIDLNKANMRPENNIINDLVYSANKTNVKMTMVNGKILYEDEKFNMPYEEEYIYKKTDELLKKLKERV